MAENNMNTEERIKSIREDILENMCFIVEIVHEITECDNPMFLEHLYAAYNHVEKAHDFLGNAESILKNGAKVITKERISSHD